ncbi:hypothetical protein [Enterovirga rhinocerotis]|uniref:Uncharacterized protein n=1 Tax=Enterovirga rhinocerotis TaxID=1339210 RepID=A0A4V3DXL6_9HYPH|nr:hypothetical protein [Enterovirga rhinocerotis]TDR89249.1 hypothetical protein EV668_3739 [Enterovirga rhinocerotis]
MKRIIASLGLAGWILSGAALAQPASNPDTVIRGGGIPPVGDAPPATAGAADRTGSIAETGRRKPPGAPLGEGSGTRPDLDRKSQEIDRRIRTGICRGC